MLVGGREQLCSCCTSARARPGIPSSLCWLSCCSSQSKQSVLPAQGSSQSKLPAMPPSVTDALWGHRVQGYQGDMATAGTTLALGGKAPENPDKASTTLSFRHRQSCSDPAAARAGSGTTRVSQSHNPSLLQNSTGWPCRY